MNANSYTICNRGHFDTTLFCLKGVLQADWNSGAFESIANSYYVTLGDSNYTAGGGSALPAFGRKLGYLSPSDWEPLGMFVCLQLIECAVISSNFCSLHELLVNKLSASKQTAFYSCGT